MQTRSNHSRTLTNQHTRIGYNANSTRTNAKMRPVTRLDLFPGNGMVGEYLTGVSCIDKDGKQNTIYLADAGRREVVKCLLMHLLDTPITIAADEELRNILDQCRKAVADQDEEARQVVACIHRTPTV